MPLPFEKDLSDVEIFLRLGATDFRKGIPSLISLIEGGLDIRMNEKRIFAFCSKDRKQIKLIYIEGAGAWLCQRKIRYGKFAWINNSHDAELIDMDILRSLLSDPIPLIAVKSKFNVDEIQLHL